jgi:hypothetical protein
MGYSGAGGNLIHEKNQKQKISWHCPFKWFSLKVLFYKLFTLRVYDKCLHIRMSVCQQYVRKPISYLSFMIKYMYKKQKNF